MTVYFNSKYLKEGGVNAQNQWKQFNERRDFWNRQQIAMNSMIRDKGDLHTNAGIPTKDFWQAVDRVLLRPRYHQKYRFLERISTTALAVGDLSYAHIMSGMGSQNTTQTGMQFGMMKTFDTIGSGTDKDPIPVFEDGVGMDYRRYMGLQSAGVDLFLQSLEQKKDFMYFNIGESMLNGNEKVVADGQVMQGLSNHRNTFQINLGAAGANIDLTSAATTTDDIFAFFRDYLRGVCIENVVDKIDDISISPEMMTNLLRPFSLSSQFKDGILLDYILALPHIGAIEQDFAFSGNEFLGFVNDRQIVSKLIGLPQTSYMLPRMTPHENYNHVLVAAQGIKVAQTLNGKKGVFYASAV